MNNSLSGGSQKNSDENYDSYTSSSNTDSRRSKNLNVKMDLQEAERDTIISKFFLGGGIINGFVFLIFPVAFRGAHYL